jgi:cell division protein FtsZ
MIMIEFNEDEVQQYVAQLKVIGVGGGGCNAINRMVTAGIQGVEFIAANTDYKSLKKSLAPKKIQLGKNLTKGLGSGGEPPVGRQAAIESTEEIEKNLAGADMLFIAAGMGGGTGTGAAPVIAEISKKLGILTVGMITRPFGWEGPVRSQRAEEGLQLLYPHLDAIITIPNDRLNTAIDQNTEFDTVMLRVDEILLHAIQGITGIIHSEGYINRDFADVKRVLTSRGKVLMGAGYGTGEDRALKAVQQAVNSPLLEDVDIANSSIVLVQVTHGQNFEYNEYTQIYGFLEKAARPGAEIIPGTVPDSNLKEGVRVTIIAAGFEKKIDSMQENVLDFKNFVNPTFQTNKPTPISGSSGDEFEVKLDRKLSEEKYEIPAYLRRKLYGKLTQN